MLEIDGRDDPTAAATAAGGASGLEKSVHGWRSPLAVAVTALLVLLGATGLWIYLAPFSAAGQVQVLVHTGLGLVLVVPYAVYQLRHWRAWRGQRLTAEMALGYTLMVGVVTSTLTGLWLTWQAVFGPRIGTTADLVHLVSGIAALAVLATHLWQAFRRRRPAAARWPALGRAQRRFGAAIAVSVAAASVAVGMAAGRLAVPAPEFPVPPDYTLPAFEQQYDLYRGNPFAPSFARTESLTMVEPAALAGSKSCGTAGCHEQILAEWQPNAHRFAAMNQPFKAVQALFADSREPAETRYCAGCHDPISLFAGAKDPSNPGLAAPGVDEGISCVVCHTISAVDERGNADYVVTPPRRYYGEDGHGLAKQVSDFLIRAYPRQHLADYDRNILREPEFCGACHKQFIPEALNRFGDADSQNQYDPWKASPWHTDDPQTDLSCRDCHMRLVEDSTDPGSGEMGDARRTDADGKHRHHGFIGTNAFMPELLALENWETHVDLTEAWVRGETVLPEIADVWPEGPVASVDVLAPPSVAAGERLVLRVVITNRKAGHTFITGPLDFIRSWVHLVVTDATGRVLAEYGSIDPVTRDITDAVGQPHLLGNRADEGTLVFESLPIDENGEILRRHELWMMAGGTGKRLVFPRQSDAQQYAIRVPSRALGPLTVRAALNYRRYRQEFLNLVVPTMEEARGVYQPTITQSQAEVTVEVTPPQAARDAASGRGDGGTAAR